ncbi:hypothetical protein J1N35_018574 [Gossypium stocksii]|uniref:Uncharacterized protein n=1 Tax=Gossypium stocksii TaxID=47602 RepID=A0A9D3VQL5_9ROSI|nr:hypothetical protein J1N35_018574 [Gossypium stocksii]
MKVFPNCVVTHFPRLKLDHKPLCLTLSSNINLLRGHHFCFLAGWVELPSFYEFVRGKWTFDGDIADSISHFTNNIREWNKSIYGYIGVQKKKLINSLSSKMR